MCLTTERRDGFPQRDPGSPTRRLTGQSSFEYNEKLKNFEEIFAGYLKRFLVKIYHQLELRGNHNG